MEQLRAGFQQSDFDPKVTAQFNESSAQPLGRFLPYYDDPGGRHFEHYSCVIQTPANGQDNLPGFSSAEEFFNASIKVLARRNGTFFSSPFDYFPSPSVWHHHPRASNDSIRQHGR